MDMEFKPTGFLIEKLIGKGVYILAGASKIGKSWLVLWLADCVSKGVPVWDLKTSRLCVQGFAAHKGSDKGSKGSKKPCNR